MKQFISMIVIMITAMVLSGCTGGRSVGQGIDDAWILSKVKSKLTSTSAVYAVDINVDVYDSEVTLRGMVETREEAQEVEDLALNIKGVSAVHNKLQIVPAGTEQEKPAVKKSPVQKERTKKTGASEL